MRDDLSEVAAEHEEPNNQEVERASKEEHGIAHGAPRAAGTRDWKRRNRCEHQPSCSPQSCWRGRQRSSLIRLVARSVLSLSSKPTRGRSRSRWTPTAHRSHAANFLKYLDAGFYDGGVVNRAVRADNTVRHDVKIEVIQFQIDSTRRPQQFPPIALERTSVTGLKHVDGAVSMARTGPDTATASFSIVIGDQPEMDHGGRRNADGQGFAVFGRVVRGKDVVRAIQASPTGRTGAYGTETLDPPIKILKAHRR